MGRWRERSARFHRRQGIRGTLALLLGVLLLGAAVAVSKTGVVFANTPIGEAELKVAIVGKIAEFIRWPAGSALDNKARPFELVVLGKTDLTDAFTRYFGEQKTTIAGHNVYLREVTEPAKIRRPHLLFVGPDFSDRLDEVLKALGDAPTLTMGDTEGFAGRGLAVNLYTTGGRVRFEISRAALKRQGLKASYRLLGLAKLTSEQQARR